MFIARACISCATKTNLLNALQRKQKLVQYKNSTRCITLYHARCNKNKADNKTVMIYNSFAEIDKKNKKTFVEMVKIFEERDMHRRGHVEFIYSALKHMEEFGVHKDLEVYKALLDVLPKGKFIPTNMFQAEFMHYPKQQQCAIDVLEQMENNGVCPDFEMEDILVNIFGKKGHPLRKLGRMLYWMPKFKNLSPWPLPNPVPNDIFELAKLAVERILSVDPHAEVKVYETSEIEDSIDNTWIVSGQSPLQQELLSKHNKDVPLYVEGSFRIWIRDKAVNYFILRADPVPIPTEPEPDPDDVSNFKIPFINVRPKLEENTKLQLKASIHEQEDGTILAVCATGTSSKDSLLSWIRHLEKDGNPMLTKIPVLFTLKSASNELSVVVEDGLNKKEETDKLEEK